MTVTAIRRSGSVPSPPHLRVAPERDRPLTLAVTSGKGGVGKSQLVASLGVLLTRAGHQVMLVDADVGCGNLDVLFDVRLPVDLREVLRGEKTAEDAVVQVPCGDVTLPLLPAPAADRNGAELAPAEQLGVIEAVSSVARACDVVLVDTGAGVSRNPMLFAAAADRVLLVTTPEPTAIRDAYAAIKVMHQAHGVRRVEIVVNEAASSRDGKAVYGRLANVVGRFLDVELGLVGVLPVDDRVPRSVRARRPVAAEYPAAAYCRAVEQMVPRLLADVPARSDGGVRFFARNEVSP